MFPFRSAKRGKFAADINMTHCPAILAMELEKTEMLEAAAIGALKSVVIFVVFSVFGSVFWWLAMRRQPDATTETGGRIVPGFWVNSGLALGGALVLVALAVWAVPQVQPPETLPLYIFMGLMLFVCWLGLAGLQPVYAVTWDAYGLEGPAGFGIWPFGPQRARMSYDAITDLGRCNLGFFVCDANGTCILWNEYYPGFLTLMSQIEDQRPDLFEGTPT